MFGADLNPWQGRILLTVALTLPDPLAGEVGTPRIVDLFGRYGIRQTFIWPGHSVETFGEQFDACAAAGREIGVHGYSHENPIAMSWVYREYDHAVFTMTIHPDVSGRPQVLLMHERLIDHINSHQGVRWVTFDEIATDFAQRHPRTGRLGS